MPIASPANRPASSRRSFLRRTAAGAALAASTFGLPLVIAGDRVKGANERPGVGFIGVGGRSQAHMGV